METYGQQSFHSVEVVCPQGHAHDQVRVLGEDLFACVDCDHLFNDPESIYFINTLISAMLDRITPSPSYFSTKN